MRILANFQRHAYNAFMSNFQPGYQSNSPALWQSQLPCPDAHSHKYNRGYVLIQGGYPVTGAARLAALAAARCGAGITAIAVSEIAFPVYASQLLSIMVKPYASTPDLHTLIHDQRVGALLIGPGAGCSQTTRHTTLTMLQTGKPVVIDADALTAFASQADYLGKAITTSCVLTPHDGEFQRLFAAKPESHLDARVRQVQTASRSMNAVILLKGAQTMIAAPDGQVIINENAPPTLATAGAGDVLAGMITSFLAQGMPALEAAAAATWIHGEAARLFGTGLIAEDLPDLLPKVLDQLIG